MKTVLSISIIALAILLSISAQDLLAADCSGDQILRMLNAGFSRVEVLDICGPVSSRQDLDDPITFRVITDTNVREGPSTVHGVVTTLGKGALVNVVGTTQGSREGSDAIWYRIAVDGKELGYVSGNLLEPAG